MPWTEEVTVEDVEEWKKGERQIYASRTAKYGVRWRLWVYMDGTYSVTAGSNVECQGTDLDEAVRVYNAGD